MNRYGWVSAAALAVAVVACGGKGQTASGQAAGSPAGAPPSVEHAEGLAEDIQTDLEQNVWPAAEAKLGELRRLGTALDSAGVSQPRPSAYGRAVDSLGAAISRRSQSDALTAANQVSRIVTGIMAAYPARIPVDVAYMDVAGRDLLYADQQQRWRAAAEAAAEVGRRYQSVQAHVRAANPALNQLVSLEIGQLAEAVGSRAQQRTASLARQFLEDVDRIEQTF